MAELDLAQVQRLTEVVNQFRLMNPHQRLVTTRALWVLFELDKQFAAERKQEKTRG